MRMMGVFKDRGRWCFQGKHVKGISNTLADPSMLLKGLTNQWPDVNGQEHALGKGRQASVWKSLHSDTQPNALHSHLEKRMKKVGGCGWGKGRV